MCLGTVLGLTARAEEIDYVEEFALADDREAALERLIPGSEDYYYYRCLQFQHRQQFDEVERLIKLWVERYRDTPRLREIQCRQALLIYPLQPDKTLAYLRQQLSLDFQHQRESLDARPDLPTRLDASAIDPARLTERAVGRHEDLAGFEDTALDSAGGGEADAAAAPPSVAAADAARLSATGGAVAGGSEQPPAGRSVRCRSIASCCVRSWTNWRATSRSWATRWNLSTSLLRSWCPPTMSTGGWTRPSARRIWSGCGILCSRCRLPTTRSKPTSSTAWCTIAAGAYTTKSGS